MADSLRHVARALDLLAWTGLVLPVFLSVYFLARLVGATGGMALVVASGVAAGLLWRGSRSAASGTANGAPRSRIDMLVLGVFLCLLLLPAVRVANALGRGASPRAFLFSDECYSLMLARGLERDVPPRDLSYAGQTIRYHFGGALLTESISRLSGLPLHAGYYGIIPIALKVILLASTLRLAGGFNPGLRFGERVLVAVVSAGVFFIDPFNVAWNVRNLFLGGAGKLATALYGMPLVQPLPSLLEVKTYDSSVLAMVWVVCLLANLDRTGWVPAGLALFAVFLTKAQIFLPFGLAWGIYALEELLRRRETKPLLAGALAVSLVLPVLPFTSTYGSLARLQPGRGANLDLLVARGLPSAQAAGLSGLPLAAALGLLLLVAGFHVFALAVVRPREAGAPAPPYRLARASIVSPLLLFAAVKLVPTAGLVERFLRVHAGHEQDLWFPAATYLNRIFDVSMLAANDLTIVLFGLLAATAVVSAATRAPARHLRQSARAAIVVSSVLAAGRLAHATWAPLSSKEKVVDPLAREALAQVPVEGSLILTNELRYDSRVEKHLPLLNVWGPTLFGHQYWASSFMFTFQHPDAAERRERLRWFWNGPWDESRRRFLAGEGITHLLVHQVDGDSFAGGPPGGLERDFENADYRIYRRTAP